jgi:metallophosphoesterase superfamily enzyme
VLGERRLILPAFGSFTGGMDACDPGIVALAGAEACALIEAGGSIRSFPLQ